MARRKHTPTLATKLLNDQRIRHTFWEGKTYYSVEDLLTIFALTQTPQAYWADLKKREPALAILDDWVEFHHDGRVESLGAVDAAGMFRIVQSLTSPAAERFKTWLAESGVQRLEELDNPEMVLARLRRHYEEAGHAAQWVDKRLRGVSTRHQITREWARRGATASDDYRALTNSLMQGVFGNDVEGLRRQKGLGGTSAQLRDVMTDLELTFTTLAETAAVELHQRRNSHGIEELLTDVRESSEAVGAARQSLEKLALQGESRASQGRFFRDF